MACRGSQAGFVGRARCPAWTPARVDGVSGLPIVSKFRNDPHRPVQDADRDDLASRLNEAYTRGDLDTDQYQSLLDGLFSATTQGQLVPVADLLPARLAVNTPAVADDGRFAPPPGVVPMGQRQPVASSFQQLRPWYYVAGGLSVVVVLIVLLLFLWL